MSETARKVYLTGIGPGDFRGMTLQAEEVITAADCLIGADRMLSCAEAVLSENRREGNGREENDRKENNRKGNGDIPRLCEYRPGEICAYIGSHPEYRRIVVLLSGDTGFYSGAKKLGQALKERFPDLSVEMIPGISSIVYLAAKLETSWEDGALVSLHGQEEDFISTVNWNRKTFLLLGGSQSGKYMTDRLKEFGMDQVILHCGTRLSYPDEKIVLGRPGELSGSEADGLCAAMILNPQPDQRTGPHIPDEEFIRGSVPMTKAEVRAVSLAQMELTEDAVVYDVGAGTGSVSVEAARSGDRIRVYAVEKKTEAVISFRVPWWLKGEMECFIDGEKCSERPQEGYLRLKREWSDNRIRVVLPRGLHTWPLADEEDTAAILDGPEVLAGLIPGERILFGDKERPETFIRPHNERVWGNWTRSYKTFDQQNGFYLKPLREIGSESYTVYFPIRKKPF